MDNADDSGSAAAPSLLLGSGRFRCPVEGCAKGAVAEANRVLHSRAELSQHLSNFHKADFVRPVDGGHEARRNPNSLLMSQAAAGRKILAMLTPPTVQQQQHSSREVNKSGSNNPRLVIIPTMILCGYILVGTYIY